MLLKKLEFHFVERIMDQSHLLIRQFTVTLNNVYILSGTNSAVLNRRNVQLRAILFAKRIQDFYNMFSLGERHMFCNHRVY